MPRVRCDRLSDAALSDSLQGIFLDMAEADC